MAYLTPLNTASPADHMFPKLTSAQQARIAVHGRARRVQADETLVEADANRNLPGVFAVGDVRGGNIKRVASAVGEGSIAVSFVHQVLAE